MSDQSPSPPPRVGTPTVVHYDQMQVMAFLMEIQRSIGDLQQNDGNLIAKTDRLISDVKSLTDKVDSIRTTINRLTGVIATVGFLIGIALAAFRFLPIG